MGIAGFSTWFAQLYPASYVPLKGMSTDHLYIDIAGILHTITRRGAHIRLCSTPVQLITMAWRRLLPSCAVHAAIVLVLLHIRPLHQRIRLTSCARCKLMTAAFAVISR